MRQQEDFRTPGGAGGSAPAASTAPLFDEQSALKAAPVVPLERVARRRRFAGWAGGDWRARMRSPLFRRSWPLALLLVATLAAAVAATGFYQQQDATQGAAQTAADAPSAAGANTTTDSETPAAARENGSARADAEAARPTRESNAAPVAAGVGNTGTLAASALGNLPGDDGQDNANELSRGRPGDERDGGKRHGRSKRRQKAKRNGGAVLFDVIR